MPHVGAASGGEDLASSDEIKVFKEEGDEEDNRPSENLTELKTSLVTEGEEEKSTDVPGSNDYGSPPKSSDCRPDSGSHSGKPFELLPHSGPIGYVVSPYAHPHNGSLGHVSMDVYPEGFSKSAFYHFLRERESYLSMEARSPAGKVPMVPPPHPGSPLPFLMYNGESFAQPPPAHMGIPPVAIDPKTGIPRPPVYHLGPPGQYPPVFSPDFTHHQLQWHTPALYPSPSAGFRSAYSSSLPPSAANLPRFSPPTLLSPYPGISHPALIAAGPKQEIGLHHSNHRSLPDYPNEQKHNPRSAVVATSSHTNSSTTNSSTSSVAEQRKTHIKKPLNAFMLYMKEMRAKVVAECTLKESAAINQILGRRWHSLSREEQAKYYEMARKERQLHMQLYPGWSARDNYALQVKKKKRKKDRNQDGDGNSLKKCRARFGLDQQSSWCKPCRRKKKCVRYKDGNDTAFESEDNMGSAGSVEAPTPDSKTEGDTDSQDTDHTHNPNSSSIASPAPQLSPCNNNNEVVDTKPRLDNNGMVRPPSPPPHRNHHPHMYHHHPLSVHQLIQPHFNSRSTLIARAEAMSRFQNPPLPGSAANHRPAANHLLTVT